MTEAQIIWPLISILVSLSAIIAVPLSIIKMVRRQPPLPEELAKFYATKENLTYAVSGLNSRIDREVGIIVASTSEQSKKLDALIATTNHTARDTDRALGRIEGAIEGIQTSLGQHIREHSK